VDEVPAALRESARSRALTLALALGAGLFALVLGSAIESRVIRYAHPGPGELEWISDVIVAGAVVGMTYLWLHLRTSRTLLAVLERRQIAMDEELRLAAQIQQGLLPDVPARAAGFEWAARMVPARVVGGDFYDFLQQDDGSVLVMLGDVSGKGIPAALLQSSLKTLFRAVVRDGGDPAQVAEKMAAALHEEMGGASYATAVLARFDPAPPRLTFVSAGHPAGLLFHEGGVRELSAGGPPLGLLPGARYESETAGLGPRDLGVFVTDGITEALEGVPLKLADALRTMALEGPLPRLADALLELAARSPGPVGVEGWQDDRTVVAFRVEKGRA
jgi:sigma-B regulation protein RsbU (phosphoserine phosphatase)